MRKNPRARQKLLKLERISVNAQHLVAYRYDDRLRWMLKHIPAGCYLINSGTMKVIYVFPVIAQILDAVFQFGHEEPGSVFRVDPRSIGMIVFSEMFEKIAATLARRRGYWVEELRNGYRIVAERLPEPARMLKVPRYATYPSRGGPWS